MPFPLPPPLPRPRRIVVLGYIVRGPVGGMVWSPLHYVLGLKQLGHDVLFIEDSTDSPWCCYDPERGATDADPSFGLRYAAKVFDHYDVADRWAYWDAHTARWWGARAADAETFCRQADLLINISGVTPLRDWTAHIPRRAFIDTDPVFTQIRHLTDETARKLAQAHTVFFSFGERVGQPGCLIPDDGFAWRPTRQPIALDHWPAVPPRPDASFNTIMLWNSYEVRHHAGRDFGMKSQSFAPYLNLPRHTLASLELAIGGKDVPRDELARAGWRITNPLEVAWWPWDYRNYITASAGEFGVAKHGYVASRSGTFSDRTAAYLASGRPTVVQDTGFSDLLPVGEGLLPFSSLEEAVAGIEAVRQDPARHQRAARMLAENYFHSDRVLRPLVDEAMSV